MIIGSPFATPDQAGPSHLRCDRGSQHVLLASPQRKKFTMIFSVLESLPG